MARPDKTRSSDGYSFTYSDAALSENSVFENVNKLVEYYRNGARKHGGRLKRYSRLRLLCSVAVTVISGIKEIQAFCPWLITVAGGLTTIFTGLLTVSKAQEYYMLSSSQHAKVYAEKLLYLGGGDEYANEPSPVQRPWSASPMLG
ncbi:MAG: hypothetical protein ACJ746_06730 [Bryobacteraceae bacterium]